LTLLQALQTEDALATPEQQSVLAAYVGWGALVDVFKDPESYQADWEERYKSAERKEWERKWQGVHDELQEKLSPEQWRTARESSLTAFYTGPEITNGMWSLLERLGFEGGAVLEPAAGCGVFLGLMPEAMARRSRLTAVELEAISAGILGQLYPDARVIHGGFESAKIPNASQDLVIGNFPFGDMKVFDKENPEAAKFSLHNYFFLKSLDKVKAGGLVVAITSAYTMDAQTPAFRRAMAERADLVGGIRLPSSAFRSSAGTQVVTDILAFRKKSDASFPGQDFLSTGMVDLGEDRNGLNVQVPVNQYFLDHPEQVLGKFGMGGLYRGDSLTVLDDPEKPALGEALAQALRAFPENIVNHTAQGLTQEMRREVLLSSEKEGLLVLHEGKPYVVENGELVIPPTLEKGKGSRLTELTRGLQTYIPLRTTLKELIAEQLSMEADESKITELRAQLNEQYDAFTESGKLPLGKKSAHRDLAIDIEWPLVQALEITKTVMGPDGNPQKAFEKAAIFNRRTIFPRTEPQEAQSLEEAISISSAFRGRLDGAFVAQLVSQHEEKVKQELVDRKLAFVNPETGILESADDYLSGFVRRKLEMAEAAMVNAPEFAANVEALRGVQPIPLPIQAITCKLGAGGWVPAEVLTRFAREVLGYSLRFEYVSIAKAWSISGNEYPSDHGQATKWSTAVKDALDLLKDCLAMKRTMIRIPHPVEEGRTIVDQTATIQAQAMQEKIEHAFTEFVRSNPEIAALVEEAYNRTFNGVVRKVWKVPDIEYFPGANREVKLEPFQKRSVVRALREPELMAHVVGAGKTYSLITIAMEQRRLGIARKPVIVVQGSTLGQFVKSFRFLYPDANVLAPNEHQRDAANRQRLMSQIATGDYDAIVIPHSFFDMVPDDPERVKWFVAAQVQELEDALGTLGRRGDRRVTSSIRARIKFYKEMGTRADHVLEGFDAAEAASDDKEVSRKEKSKIKAGVKRKNHLLAKFDRHTDQVMTWEQLGVDSLMVDEAHRYKRRDFYTGIDRSVKGVDKGSSKRSMGLLMKADYIREKNNNRNLVLATGTPITNTIAEIWTMLGYVRPDVLEAYNVSSFDEFVGTFALISTELEMTYSGKFAAISRLRKFVNGPELLTMWGMAADNVRPEDITRVTLPRVQGGNMRIIDLEPTETVSSSIAHWRNVLLEWQQMSGKEKAELSHIPILVMGRSRQISVDPRLVDPNLPDLPGSKLDECVERAFDVYQRGAEERWTQIIFCDLYQSKLSDEHGRRFNVYNAIKAKLIARGVPAAEIEIVSSTNVLKDEARAELFEQVQAGLVRFLIGGTESLGIGTNVQDRLKAIHHLDLPMTPAQLEQRNGRIVRGGNQNEEVEINSYGVRRTLDSALAQIMMNKAKFIQQVMEGSVKDREFDDPSGSIALSAAEMLAAYADDPLVFRKIQVEVELQRLRQSRAAWADEKKDFRMQINSEANAEMNQVQSLQARKALNERLALLKTALPELAEDFKNYSLVEALAEIPKQVAKLNPYTTDVFTNIVRRPAPLVLRDRWTIRPSIVVELRRSDGEDLKPRITPRAIDVRWELDGVPQSMLNGNFNSGQGTMLFKSIAASIERSQALPAQMEVRLRNTRATLATLREQIEAPFEREGELVTFASELDELNGILEARGKEEAQQADVHSGDFAELDQDFAETVEEEGAIA
jgi:N12 class adenine-specific DNA methylase